MNPKRTIETGKKGPSPTPWLQGVAAYQTPALFAPIDLRLDGNEGMAPPLSLLQALGAEGAEVMRRYPDTAVLRDLLASRWKVEPAQVLVTAGGDDAIDRICRAFLCAGRQLIQAVPTFEMIGRYARLTGATVTSLPWPAGPYPTERVLAAAGQDTAVIAVVSPNNPTGAVARPADLEALAREVPQAVLLVDLAYGEFADEDLMTTALSLPNAIAVRSLSKAFGLAGLRVGCAVGSAALISSLAAAGHPYAVSRPSLALAAARLTGGEEEVCAYIGRVKEERQALCGVLAALGAAALPSQGNFVLCRFARAEWLREALAGLGIAVRIFPGQPELEGHLRITCPGEPGLFSRLERALGAAMAPQALLLDMDGVIADVSQSYRRAIQATARFFGVELSAGDISAAKKEPGSNNDWVVTRRLLLGHGRDIPLPEVTARFELFYQGGGENEGYSLAERLTCDPDLLRRLSRRLALGVVTGRPRADALRFLKRAGVADCFQLLVCMEDSLPKPDPAPVRLALERMNLTRAWMVGDTPDDLVAARGAGVVPLGMIAPGEDPTTARDTLLRAGAARVLTRLEEVEGWLP